ncbi:hypothetical protein ZWY2020_047780 [Hordeum vulgare]|nr:hypothetical protein ZWY2020_047780 [Hordeum vulgare]
MPFRFPDADRRGGGGGFDEIGSEGDLFSTFMGMDKIAGVARDRAAEMSSSPPCPTKHRHSACFDGFAMSCGGPGGQQDGGGGRGLFADVLDAKKAISSEQLSKLASVDPKRAKRVGLRMMRGESAVATGIPVVTDLGEKGEGSDADQECGGEISTSLPDDGKTFSEPRQPSRETKVCGFPTFSHGCSAGVHRHWEVRFSFSKDASRVDQFGSLVVHHSSGWAMIRDAEGDILAGRYLIPNDLRIGLEIEMDGFLVMLIKPYFFECHCGKKIASVPPRVGGKFWVLEDQNDDSDVEDDAPPCSSVPSPISPASPVGVSVECKLQQDFQLPTKKMGAPRPKPWIGPLPKVRQEDDRIALPVSSLGTVQEVTGFSSPSIQAEMIVADPPVASVLETPDNYISEDAVIQFGDGNVLEDEALEHSSVDQEEADPRSTKLH